MYKIKARFIFYDENEAISIKGYMTYVPYEDSYRYYLYGANNLKDMDINLKNLLINTGVNSLDTLKELIPSFKLCILDSEAAEIIASRKNVIFQDLSKNSSIHITLDPWIIQSLKNELNRKTKEHLDTIKNYDNSELVGIIQPNLSSIISEILVKYIVEEEFND